MTKIKKWNSYNIFTMNTDVIEFDPTNLFYLSKLKINKSNKIELKTLGINIDIVIEYTDYGFCIKTEDKTISHYLISNIWNNSRLDSFKSVVYNSKSLRIYDVKELWNEIILNSPRSPYCFIYNEACSIAYKKQLKQLNEVLDYITYFIINKRA
ncbi:MULTISPECIES: hypothetical protein [Bacteria]|uniref:hypothetical protein n=1 Tax=Bacteria TaxID=2 RepID=UPI003F3C83A0